MSSSKPTWWRPATVVLLALAAMALWLVVSGSNTEAGGTPGTVSIVPADLDLPAGGTGTVSVVIDPASSGDSIWIVQFRYDPTVARVKLDGSDPMCTVLGHPGGGIAFAAGCATKDAVGADGIHDTAVAFGGWVENDGGNPRGFESQQTVATFTFEAVGAVGAHTDLTIQTGNSLSILGPNGEENTPAVNNGGIDIVEGNPGDERQYPDTNCDENINIGDSINIARSLVDLPVTNNGCPLLDSTVSVDGTNRQWGDTNCDKNINIGDSINIARSLVDLPVTNNGCPVLDTTVSVDGTNRKWGDTNCDNNINIGDSINIARSLVDLPVTNNGCPAIDSTVTVS